MRQKCKFKNNASLLETLLLFAAATVCSMQMPVSVQAKSISECSEVLSKRGFQVIQKDFVEDKLFEDVYGFAATQNNEKWRFKMDQSCKILYEHRDDWLTVSSSEAKAPLKRAGLCVVRSQAINGNHSRDHRRMVHSRRLCRRASRLLQARPCTGSLCCIGT